MVNNCVVLPELPADVAAIHELRRYIEDAEARDPKITRNALAMQLVDELRSVIKPNCVTKTW